MCRNIKTLHNFEPPASEEEIRASAIQFVRKPSGFTHPSKANDRRSRVIVGENRTFRGNEAFLAEHRVEVVILDEPRCISLMERFQIAYPDVWKEDIGE
jgi:hypothetical protein